MVDINDPLDLEGRLEREMTKLDKAVEAGKEDEEKESDGNGDGSPEPVPVKDANRIKQFLTHLQANKDNKPQTNANHVQRLRLTSQRSSTPLVEMTMEELDDFTTDLQFKYEISKKTINHYKGSWRPFFRHLGKEWYNEISFYKLNQNEVDKDKVYSDEEVEAILRECSSRETAAVAILSDTGCRIGLLCSTARKHLDLEGQVPVININGKAPVKGADGTIPLTTSRSYIVNYLQGDHPRPNKDDAGLIHRQEGHYNKNNSGALSPKRLREKIKEAMEKAGIPKDRRRVHNFRHTAVTRWLRMGVPEKVILHRTKWSDASMLDRYGHLLDDDLNKMTAEVFGLIDPEDTEEAATPEQSMGECPTCGTVIRPNVRYCPGCGTPLTVDAAEGLSPEDIQDPEETAEDLMDIDGVSDEMDTASVLERLLENNPGLLEDIRNEKEQNSEEEND